MYAFAQKLKASQQTTAAKSMISGRAHLGQSTEVQAVQQMLQIDAEEPEADLTGQAPPRVNYDFSRISLHPPETGVIQTKLSINKPGDEYEQEADRVAERVMRMPESQLQRACPCGGGCAKCQSEQPSPEHKSLQTSHVQASDTGQIPAPPIVHEVLRSPGQPLDPATRAFMEPRFGHDFSQVRVHTGAAAADSVRALNALAYTVDGNIAFAKGRYSPHTSEGRRLMAHELVHAIQQGHGTSLTHGYSARTAARVAPAISCTVGLRVARQSDPRSAVGGESTEGVIRIIRLDNNVIAEIGRGNAEVASTLRQLAKDPRVRLEMSRGIYLETTRVTGDMLAARKALIEKLHIRIVDEPIARRLPTYEKYAHSSDFPTHGQGKVTKGEAATLEDLPHIASAAAGGKDVQLWTFDSRVQTNAKRLGVEIAPESKIPILKNVPDDYVNILKLVPEVTAPDVRKSGGSSGGGGGTVPVASRAQEVYGKIPGPEGETMTSASGEVNVPQRGSVTPMGGTARPVTSTSGEIVTGSRSLGLPTVRSAVGGELQGQLVGLVADYFKYKLNQYFDRKKFEQRMRELQPQIEDMKQMVYDASPKETRALINQHQMYWVIRLRVSVKTTVVIAGQASTTLNSGPIPELVSVRISASPAGEQGPIEEKTPVVAPAQHAVILLENMQNITYSEPIVSWHNAEMERIGKAAAEFSKRATSSQPTEQIDPLRFSATGKVVTTESLLAWARRTHPRGLADQGLLRDLYGSHEFSGSQDAHDRAAMALFLRLREEGGTAPVAK